MVGLRGSVLVAAALVGLVGMLASPAGAEDDPPPTDAELIAKLDALWTARKGSSWTEKDEEALQAVLTAMAARGGSEIEAALARDTASWWADERGFRQYGNLERLAVLWRVRGPRGPLVIDVEGPSTLAAVYPVLPVLGVAVRNVGDVAVDFTWGGDYRSGRQARWRIELRNAAGRSEPVKEVWGVGGGVYDRRPMQPGESWETDLDVQSFIASPPPGTYALTVQYHDHDTIANRQSVEGLVVLASEPLTLVVRPRPIDMTAAEQAEAVRLVRAIEPRKPVRVVAGTYDPRAHGTFIDPESAPGRLLAMRWKAVPALLDAVADDAPDPVRRAWMLALLFGLTGLHDPRDHPLRGDDASGVLPGCEWIDAPWNLEHREHGTPMSGAWGGGGRGSSADAPIDPAQQAAFAARWRALRDCIDVTVRAD